MNELYVIRHGIAEMISPAGGGDESRELTKKGREKVRLISKTLKDREIFFDRIVSSPLTRAVQTAEIVSRYCSDREEIALTDYLKPGSSYEDLIEYLNRTEGAEKVAIVGHEPFLSGFISYCLSRSKSSFVEMKKSGVALLEIDGMIIPGKAKLLWLMGPKQFMD
ncbi:phosphohistidine phosphatase SixA [Methanocella sp. CWC-04]|uniref:Phosphohistidine phosphatase SixA n=1 Tax=Methanooceanicella nereidis TaxID=2052831 RepID=A0AAP2RBK2_9EURY|nr:phosphohistidine phosphatase SixA [Methanocella sp. CWC-04]MCD1293615.1 phosphohistidine phosphatase SixA [Methanocella sp. CWC-04]